MARAKKKNDTTPTDDEVMEYTNVPVAVAAKYIGWSPVTITNALKQERAPFGFASENPRTHTFSYNISPGLLVKYKNGDLPTYRLKEVINLASDGVEQILNAKMAGLKSALNIVMDTALA